MSLKACVYDCMFVSACVCSLLFAVAASSFKQLQY